MERLSRLPMWVHGLAIGVGLLGICSVAFELTQMMEGNALVASAPTRFWLFEGLVFVFLCASMIALHPVLAALYPKFRLDSWLATPAAVWFARLLLWSGGESWTREKVEYTYLAVAALAAALVIWRLRWLGVETLLPTESSLSGEL